MAFSRNFLADIAQEKNLSSREKEIFLALLGDDKSRPQIAEILHLSSSAVSTCLTGIYRKFQIAGSGPVKESRLKDYLTNRYRRLKSENSEDSSIIDSAEPSIDVLVQEVRQQIQPYIRERCGTMRVLDMNQPIELTGKRGIYTNVNILERITGRRRLGITELLQNHKLEDFNRVELNRISEEQVPGLEAVKRYRKLMVLGKPGAGKTTFLKYLAMQCIEGQFHSDCIPIFISLRDLPRKNILLLSQYVIDLFSGWNLNVEVAQLRELFKQGKMLVLLDGLDEIRERESLYIRDIVREFCDNYPNNHFVITCRIAAIEYIFERFTDVEVSDFDIKQITTFAQNWFRLSDPQKAEYFIQKLQENKPIQELATNPLLLTLLCMVFGETAYFPANRSELYKEGLDVLLTKWDAKRDIERDQVYKNLSLQHKEDLLSQIALTIFEQKDYFFKQKTVEAYIGDFIRKLSDTDPEPEILRLDSEAVLKSIEAQHGLLVERAKGIYSFSHLTFQEYLSAKRIVDKSDLETLMEHITDKHWWEIFLLTAGIMQKADKLVLLMKQKIDSLIASEEKLQKFLSWIGQQSGLPEFPYQPSAVYTFCHGLDKTYDFVYELDNNLTHARNHALELAYNLVQFLNRARELASDISCVLIRNLDRANDYILAGDLYRTLMNVRQYAHNLGLDSRLQLMLQQLQDFLPETSYENWNNFKQWWQLVGQYWTLLLIEIIEEFKNIDYDWQFSKLQKKLLQQYYDANKLLIDCLNGDCYVSREVRQEIEDTLFLPMSEIEKRQQGKVG